MTRHLALLALRPGVQLPIEAHLVRVFTDPRRDTHWALLEAPGYPMTVDGCDAMQFPTVEALRRAAGASMQPASGMMRDAAVPGGDGLRPPQVERQPDRYVHVTSVTNAVPTSAGRTLTRCGSL